MVNKIKNIGYFIKYVTSKWAGKKVNWNIFSEGRFMIWNLFWKYIIRDENETPIRIEIIETYKLIDTTMYFKFFLAYPIKNKIFKSMS